jgi:hypothetical protein
MENTGGIFYNCCNCLKMVQNNTEKSWTIKAEKAVILIPHSRVYPENNKNYVLRITLHMIHKTVLSYPNDLPLLTQMIKAQNLYRQYFWKI